MHLNLKKASPTALINAAQGYLEKGRLVEAEEHLLAVLDRDLTDEKALALLAEVYLGHDKRHSAINCLARAVNANPQSPAYKKRLIEISAGVIASSYDPLLEQALTHCLESGDQFDCTKLKALWPTLLVLNPDFNTAFALKDRKSLDPANTAFFASYKDFRPLMTPYVLFGLRHILVGTLLFEEFFSHIRRHLLLHKDRFEPGARLILASALSHNIFQTDYIHDTTAEEDGAVKVLREQTEAGQFDPENIAVLACYMPLYTLKNPPALAEALKDSPALALMGQEQLTDYFALRDRAERITAITEIDSGTSAAVRTQYEEFPYPRWKMMDGDSVAYNWRTRNARFIGDAFNQKLQILNAGCGTGQEPAMLSFAFPKSDILAVDLSRSSIAYGMGRAEEYGLKNITFRHGDILRLGSLGRSFDIVTSMGVLHHMKDPVAGWRILRDLVKPGGFMIIGLYSKVARRALLQAQEIARQSGYKNDATGMKAFRRRAGELLSLELLKDITGFRDYFIMSMYRDMLFHVQETDYDLKELKKIIAGLGLEFLGFSLNEKVLANYAREYPKDIAMNDLDNWSAFEEKNPRTFRDMYYLWLRKPL